ncbi:hypothetical protein BDW59DRAFT_158867 [Aspergillus cavernicola]|uniref:Uncharacterized protein n=1 Tax=Aspergillus cavernicola TaxID=176166 RepID=A0ABR4IPK7_9EURO
MLTPTSSATTPTSATSSETPESTSATTDDPNPSHRQSNAGMIGGIVGGVVAMLIIGLIVYLVYRKKKRRGKRFTLVRWRYGPRMDDGQVTTAGNEPTSTAQPEPQPQSSSTIASSTVTGPPNIQLPIIPEGQSLALSPYLVSSPDSQTDSRRTIPSASSASPNTLFSSSSKSTPNTNYPTLAIPLHPESIHPALRQQQTHLPTAHSTPPNPTPSSTSPSIPNPHESTPELFDTGFYRGRLELPENSSRELINIPLTAKLKERQQKQLAGSPGPIITPDGAILTANFNNQPVHPGLHAMSFMNFDSGFDSSGDSRFEACWSRCRRGSGEKAKERTRRGS